MRYNRSDKNYYRSEPSQDVSRNVQNSNKAFYKVNASSLRHRIKIYERDVAIDDGYGGFTYGTKLYKEVWASIQQLQARQIFDYKGKDIEATHVIKIRGDIDLPLHKLEKMFIELEK